MMMQFQYACGCKYLVVTLMILQPSDFAVLLAFHLFFSDYRVH